MLRWILTNLRTFLLAFIIALAVWVSAVTAADPDETRIYPAAIQIEYVNQDPSLVLYGDVPSSVEISIRAPRSIWDRLQNDPDPVHAIVDLANFDAGTHTVKVQIQVNQRPYRVVTITPAEFELVLEPLVIKTFPIDLTITGEPSPGYQAGAVTINPDSVQVSGPVAQVNKIASISAVFDLSEVRRDVSEEVLLQALDASGQQVQETSIHPEIVNLTIPVTRLSGFRDLAVKVVTYGRPASGYTLTSVASTPAVVTVFSEDAAVVNSLPGYVETAAIDLSGGNTDIETIQALILPQGVSVVGDRSVLVQIGISAIQGSLKITNQAITISNLGSGLQVKIAPLFVDVILTGPLPSLNMLTTTSLRVILDLSGLNAGTYHLTPQVEILVQGVIVESIIPGTVEVVITPVITPTP